MTRSLCDNGDGLWRSRRGVLFSDHSTTVIGNLTGGIFSTTLLLLLLKNTSEAENLRLIALNTAVISAAGAAQFLSPLLFEHLRTRRGTVCFLEAIYHFINIILLPMLVLLPIKQPLKAYLYIAAGGIMTAAHALAAPAYSVWRIHSLPESCRSDFFVFENMTRDLITQILLLVLSVSMDAFTAHDAALAGILLMRGLAAGAVALEYMSRARMAEPEYPSAGSRVSVLDILRVPLSSKPFLCTVLISMLWNFGSMISGTFYQAYLLDGAKLSYTYINLAGILGLPISLYLLPKWNKRIRERGWLSVFSVSVFLYGLCYLTNGLVTDKSPWMYFVSTIYCMTVAGGSTLCNANLAYLFMPDRMENGCLAFFNLCSVLASVAGSAAAEKFCVLHTGKTLYLFGLALECRAYICFLAFLIYSLNAVLICLLNRYFRHRLINSGS